MAGGLILVKQNPSGVENAPAGKVRVIIDSSGRIALKDEAGTVFTPQALIASLETLIATKQDASTAATDAELVSAVAGLTTAINLKQDASSAATDAELASAISTLNAALAAESSAREAAKAVADAALPKAGGAMTGALTLAGDASTNLQPVTKQQLTAALSALVNGAPEALDTLKEISERLGLDESAEATLIATVATKLAKSANLSDIANAGTALANLGGASVSALAAEQGRAEVAETAKLAKVSNLSDLASASTARTNLGLGTAATKDSGAAGEAGKVLVADDAFLAARAAKAEVEILNLGTDWSAGERLFGFALQNSAGKKMEIKLGTTAAPDQGNQPIAVFSRVLETPEAAFSGDGAGNLGALRAHTTAVVGSQGQAIGLVGSAITFSTYEEGHSLADGIGGYLLGISKGGSTRTGMGLFANGRTETNTGRATGIEVTVDNESETEDSWTGTFPRTKAIHMHGTGLKRSAVGLFVSDKGIGTHTAIAAMTGALISSAFIRDDSEAPWSHLIKGKHGEAALAVASGAGSVVIGIEKPALATTLLEVNGGGETHDPLYNFKVTGSKSVRGRLIENGGTGQVNCFVSGASNTFVTGTVNNDSGLGFGAGTTFHIGANGKTSMLRINESGIALNGAPPVAKAGAIASPAETLAALKTAVDAVRVALTNVGITA